MTILTRLQTPSKSSRRCRRRHRPPIVSVVTQLRYLRRREYFREKRRSLSLYELNNEQKTNPIHASPLSTTLLNVNNIYIYLYTSDAV